MLKSNSLVGNNERKTNKYGALPFLLGVFLALVIILSIVSPSFLTPGNMTNMFRQVSMTAIIAVGMTMVILTGEIDLSVGSLVALAGIVFAWLMVKAGINWGIAMILTLAMGAGVGAFIGFIKVIFNVPSFIITLSLYTALRSAGYVITNAFPIAPLPSDIGWIGRGFVGPIPVPVIIMIAAYVIGYFMLNHTTWGRSVYAVGSNVKASRLSGLNIKFIKVSVFVICSFCAALAALILSSRLDSGTPTVASGWELEVIAAVIIGGTAMNGGSGNIIGTFVGAVFVATLNNGMTLLGVSPYVQGIISGLVILVAVLIGSKQIKNPEN